MARNPDQLLTIKLRDNWVNRSGLAAINWFRRCSHFSFFFWLMSSFSCGPAKGCHLLMGPQDELKPEKEKWHLRNVPPSLLSFMCNLLAFDYCLWPTDE